MLVFREVRKWMLERLYMHPSSFVATTTKAVSTREDANTIKKAGEGGSNPWACTSGKK